MNIDSAFPSTYLKASDLGGKTPRVVMSHIKMEDLGGDHKPVLYFKGHEKGLVLNRTNSNNIAATYGTETDNWPGKEIWLYQTMVDFQGRSVDAIRVRTTPPPGAQQQHRKPDPGAGRRTGGSDGYDDGFAPDDRDRVAAETRKDATAQAGYAAELDDEIPF